MDMSKYLASNMHGKTGNSHRGWTSIDPSGYMHPLALIGAGCLATPPPHYKDSVNCVNLIKTLRLFSAVHKCSSCGDCQVPVAPGGASNRPSTVEIRIDSSLAKSIDFAYLQSARFGDKPRDMATVNALMTQSITWTCARDIGEIWWREKDRMWSVREKIKGEYIEFYLFSLISVISRF